MANPGAVNKAVQVTNGWLKELGEHDDYLADRDRAYTCLRAVLHELRDRLTVDEAVHLGAQLPTIIRGMYYGSWSPHKQPSDVHEVDEFYAGIRARLRSSPDLDVERATRAVFEVLKNHVTEGEVDDVVAMLPKPLQQLWH